MNFWELIFSFFSFLAFGLAILFFIKKRGDKIANRLLGIYILLFAYNIGFHVLHWSKKLYDGIFLNLVLTDVLTWVLYGPILYFYVKRIVEGSKFKRQDLVHFLPLIFVIINYSQLFFSSLDTKIEISNGHTWSNYIFIPTSHVSKAIIVTMLIYTGAIIFHLKNELRNQNKSRWLDWLGYSFFGYVVSFSSYFILGYFNISAIEYDYIIGFSMIFFIGMLAYFGFLQPEIFDGLSMDEVIPIKKYQKTGLSNEVSSELKNKLIVFMEQDKIYLKNDISLKNIAEVLNISRNQASQVINEHFKMSFYDFINDYRITEALRMFDNNNRENLNITEIAYTVGFNNRISFYKAFKKFVGMNPSDYVKGKNIR